MQLILFGRKKKYVAVPDGYVMLDNQVFDANMFETRFASHSFKGDLLYNSDMFLNCTTGKFEKIKPDSHEDFDGNPIFDSIDNYSVIVRDKRALLTMTGSAPILDDNITIVFIPEYSGGWHIIE
jgi:hypothetical protein